MHIFPSTLQKSDQSGVLFDTHPETGLNFKHVQNELRKGYQRPFLLIDSNIVQQKTRRFKACNAASPSALCS